MQKSRRNYYHASLQSTVQLQLISEILISEVSLQYVLIEHSIGEYVNVLAEFSSYKYMCTILVLWMLLPLLITTFDTIKVL